LHFFLLNLGVGSRGFFFSFSPGSQCVLTMFPMISPSSLCVPQHVLHSTSLLSHMLWQMLSSIHLYRWAKRNEL
jgi:hypothetical protein